MTRSEIKRAKAGTPGTLFVPSEAGYVGEMGDDIQIVGPSPDLQGLAFKWRGKIIEKSDAGVTISGRFWMGNKSALDSI